MSSMIKNTWESLCRVLFDEPAAHDEFDAPGHSHPHALSHDHGGGGEHAHFHDHPHYHEHPHDHEH